MTKEECKELVMDLKNNMDRNFENSLDEILSVAGSQLEEAECNYNFARSVFAALLLKNVRSFDFNPSGPHKKVTVTVSKNAAILDLRY